MAARMPRIVPQTVRLGGMRQRVDIKRPATAIDSRGQITGADVSLSIAWPCEIRTLSGVELINARQTYPTASHVVRGWWRRGTEITVRHYLQWGDRRLNIGHITDLGQDRGLIELLCAEAVDGS